MQMLQFSFFVSIQGTTGHPKAVLTTHHILVNSAIIVGKYLELNAEVLYMCISYVNYSRKTTTGKAAAIILSATYLINLHWVV